MARNESGGRRSGRHVRPEGFHVLVILFTVLSSGSDGERDSKRRGSKESRLYESAGDAVFTKAPGQIRGESR